MTTRPPTLLRLIEQAFACLAVDAGEAASYLPTIIERVKELEAKLEKANTDIHDLRNKFLALAAKYDALFSARERIDELKAGLVRALAEPSEKELVNAIAAYSSRVNENDRSQNSYRIGIQAALTEFLYGRSP